MIRVFFDFETTGLEPGKHSIIEAYFGFDSDRKLVAEWQGQIRPMPGREISEDALAANRRTREDLEKGKDPKIAMKEIRQIFDQFAGRGERKRKMTLIGYNSAGFDMLFLRDFAKAQGWHDLHHYISWPGYDVAILAAFCLGEEWETLARRGLRNACLRFNVPFVDSEAHGARYDALRTRDLYWAICDRIGR